MVVIGLLTFSVFQKNLLLFRSTLLLLFCATAIFGSKAIGWSGAGPLGALSLPFVAALRWRKEIPAGEKVLKQLNIISVFLSVNPLIINHSEKNFFWYYLSSAVCVCVCMSLRLQPHRLLV